MSRRNRLLTAGLVVAVGALHACSTGQPRFSQMSGEQLHSYNWDKPFAQQVRCQELTSGGSRIPKRICMNNVRWHHFFSSGFARVDLMTGS